jgi:hypothetical protein
LPPLSVLPDDLPLKVIGPGRRWYRIHLRVHDPVWWGSRRDRRFDDPNGEFGVCYFGTSREACVAEALLRRPPVRILGLSDLERRMLTEVETHRRLRLVQVYGAGLARLGVTAAVSSGHHPPAQQLSRALYTHPATVDGLLYRPRHDDDTLAVALNERAGSPKVLSTRPLTADLDGLRRLLAHYGVALNL